MGKNKALGQEPMNCYISYNVNCTFGSVKATIRAVDKEINTPIKGTNRSGLSHKFLGKDAYNIISGDVNLTTSAGTQLTVQAGVVAGDTVSINGRTYTAVNGSKVSNGEFNLNGGTTAIATDIADSYVNDTRPQLFGNYEVTSVSVNNITFTQTDEKFLGSKNVLVPLTSSTASLPLSTTTNGYGNIGQDGVYYGDTQTLFALGDSNMPSAYVEPIVEVEIDCTVNNTLATASELKAILKFVEKMHIQNMKKGDLTLNDGISSQSVRGGTSPYSKTVSFELDKVGNRYWCILD